jgi:hypothetical protein
MTCENKYQSYSNLFVGIALWNLFAVTSFAAPKSVLQIDVDRQGSATITVEISQIEDQTFKPFYLVIPFSLQHSNATVQPGCFYSVADFKENSTAASVISFIVPPRTPSVTITAKTAELVREVDPLRRRLELHFSYPDPPRGVDWLLAQPNSLFRFSEIRVGFPEDVSEITENTSAHWDGIRRRYTLDPQEDEFVVNWRGAPGKEALLWSSLLAMILGIFAGLGPGLAIYRFSKILPALGFVVLAFLALAVTLYRGRLVPNFPWNDLLSTSATFLGILLVAVGTTIVIKVRPLQNQ